MTQLLLEHRICYMGLGRVIFPVAWGLKPIGLFLWLFHLLFSIYFIVLLIYEETRWIQ